MDFHTDGSSEVSFINLTVQGADFWSIDPSGDYEADCRQGRAAALELSRFVFFGEVPTILGSVARAIVQKGRFGGLEIGFFQQISEGMVGFRELE